MSGKCSGINLPGERDQTAKGRREAACRRLRKVALRALKAGRNVRFRTKTTVPRQEAAKAEPGAEPKAEPGAEVAGNGEGMEFVGDQLGVKHEVLTAKTKHDGWTQQDEDFRSGYWAAVDMLERCLHPPPSEDMLEDCLHHLLAERRLGRPQTR